MFRRFRFAIAGVAFAGLGGAGMLTQATPAFAASSPSAAEQFIADINALRASVGVGALKESATLDSIAQGWALHLENAGSLSHNPSLVSDAPSNWQKLGENVGVGPSVSSLQSAFTGSPEHYANMVDGSFNQIGVDVEVDSSGALWVTEDYMEAPLVAATPAPTPKPTPAPTPAPVVHSAPAPTPTPAATPTPAPVIHYSPAPTPTPVVRTVSVPAAPAPAVTPSAAATPAVVTPAPAATPAVSSAPAPATSPAAAASPAPAASSQVGAVGGHPTVMKLTPAAADSAATASPLKGAALAVKSAAVWVLDLAIPLVLVVMVLFLRRPQRGRRRPVWA